jgi:hypothetical protein
LFLGAFGGRGCGGFFGGGFFGELDDLGFDHRYDYFFGGGEDRDTLRQRQVGDVEVFAYAQCCDVYFYRRRDVGGEGFDLEVPEVVFYDAAFFYSVRFTHYVDGDVGVDGLVAVDGHEVDVDEVASDGVALDFAEHGEVFLFVDLEVDEDVGAGFSVEGLFDLFDADQEGDGAFYRGAVEDCGDLAGRTRPPGGAFASL